MGKIRIYLNDIVIVYKNSEKYTRVLKIIFELFAEKGIVFFYYLLIRLAFNIRSQRF